jgi:hypothetical protein
MYGSGLLAIWSDIPPESENDYLQWLTREHTLERVSTDGFMSARVFRAEDVDVRRYLIIYELADARAVDGPDYVRKLNNPTPWSRRIMPLLKNFVRGGGPIIARAGSGEGAFVVPIIIDSMPAKGQAVVDALALEDGVCGALLMQTDQTKTGVATREKTMRQKDETFVGLLLVDGLDADAMRSAWNGLKATVPSLMHRDAHPGLYRQVFGLTK